jgi:hypothetical protein
MKTILLMFLLLATISCNEKPGKINGFTYDRSGGGDLNFTISREANNFKIQVTRANFSALKKELILPFNDPLAIKLMPIFEEQWHFTDGPESQSDEFGGSWETVFVHRGEKTQSYERVSLDNKDGAEVLDSLYDFVESRVSKRKADNPLSDQ